MAHKQFFRSLPRKGFPLYWILLVYLVVGYFWPVIGFLAIICMIAPVAFAVRKGRWWCGNACPRGNFYDRVLTKSGVCTHKRIPYLHGDVHLHHVRHTDVPGLGRLERHGTCILDNHTDYHYCRRDSFFYLRSAHMVLVLPYGNAICMGDSSQRQTSQQLPSHSGRRKMHYQM